MACNIPWSLLYVCPWKGTPKCAGQRVGCHAQQKLSSLACPPCLIHALLQVSYRLLTACYELTPLYAVQAVNMANMLVWRAIDTLPRVAPSRTGSSSTSSGLTGMLLQQLEQSSFLQQLPVLISSSTKSLQTRTAGAGSAHDESTGFAAGDESTSLAYALCKMVGLFVELHWQPFLAADAAGQQCLVPAMQLALTSQQNISKCGAGRAAMVEGSVGVSLDRGGHCQ